MNVVLFGATGNSGSRIRQELISRGHQVTAVARNISKLPSNVKGKQDDLSNVDSIGSIIQGADAVISAYAPPPDNTDALLGVTERQIAAVKKSGKIRLIVVGGAASLEVAPASRCLLPVICRQSGFPSLPHMPKPYRSFRLRILTGHTSARQLFSNPASALASSASA